MSLSTCLTISGNNIGQEHAWNLSYFSMYPSAANLHQAGDSGAGRGTGFEWSNGDGELQAAKKFGRRGWGGVCSWWRDKPSRGITERRIRFWSANPTLLIAVEGCLRKEGREEGRKEGRGREASSFAKPVLDNRYYTVKEDREEGERKCPALRSQSWTIATTQ